MCLGSIATNSGRQSALQPNPFPECDPCTRIVCSGGIIPNTGIAPYNGFIKETMALCQLMTGLLPAFCLLCEYLKHTEQSFLKCRVGTGQLMVSETFYEAAQSCTKSHSAVCLVTLTLKVWFSAIKSKFQVAQVHCKPESRVLPFSSAPCHCDAFNAAFRTLAGEVGLYLPRWPTGQSERSSTPQQPISDRLALEPHISFIVKEFQAKLTRCH